MLRQVKDELVPNGFKGDFNEEPVTKFNSLAYFFYGILAGVAKGIVLMAYLINKGKVGKSKKSKEKEQNQHSGDEFF